MSENNNQNQQQNGGNPKEQDKQQNNQQKNGQNQQQQKQQEKKTLTSGYFNQRSRFLCMFCGGKKCPKEDYRKNPYENALVGVHSDWITDNILATQRLSTRIIEQFDVIGQLKKHNVKGVFNLQEPGEHPFCGDGIDEQTGFTYRPEDLIKNGIYFFNVNWLDMTVTTEKNMMRIMDFMDFIFNKQEGKILVHCHAGTGRTGLAIASWLIYGQGFTAEQAIKQFRSRRKGGLSKGIQVKFLKNFEKFVIENRKSFSTAKKMTMQEIIDRQKSVTLQSHQKMTKFIPVIVEVTFKELIRRVKEGQASFKIVMEAFFDPNNRKLFSTPWDYFMESEIDKLKKYYDGGKWAFNQNFDIRVIAQTLLDFFDSLIIPSINEENVASLDQQLQKSVGKLQEVLQNKKILEIFNRGEFNLIDSLILFLQEIIITDQNQDTMKKFQQNSHNFQNIQEEAGGNMNENGQENSSSEDQHKNLINNFIERLIFSIYQIKNADKTKYINESRQFELEKFNQADSSTCKIKQKVKSFSTILMVWHCLNMDETEELSEEQIHQCYNKGYNLKKIQEAQNSDKKKKNKVVNIPELKENLSKLVVGNYNKLDYLKPNSVMQLYSRDSNQRYYSQNNFYSASKSVANSQGVPDKSVHHSDEGAKGQNEEQDRIEEQNQEQQDSKNIDLEQQQ